MDCKECKHFSFLKGHCNKGYSKEECEATRKSNLSNLEAPESLVRVAIDLHVEGDLYVEGDLSVAGKIVVEGLEITSQDLKEFLQDRQEKEEYLNTRISKFVLINTDYGVSTDDYVYYTYDSNVKPYETFVLTNTDYGVSADDMVSEHSYVYYTYDSNVKPYETQE